MLFVTYQPLKNDRRKAFYQGNTKPLYSFCKKPIFATAYVGDLIGFLSEMLLSSPQQGEKLVIFEADNYIALNKVRWNKYARNGFYACLGDSMAERTALENKTYNVTKKEKGKKTYYEYVVCEDDIKKLFEFKLINEAGEVNCILDDSKERKLLHRKCNKFVHPLEIDYAIYRYNDLVFSVINTINENKNDYIKETSKTLKKEHPNISKEELENHTLREFNKYKLFYHKLVFISTLLPYVMVAVLQRPEIFSTKGHPLDFINRMEKIKIDEDRYFKLLKPKKAKETKSDIDIACDKAYAAISKLDNKIRSLFFIRKQENNELLYNHYKETAKMFKNFK